MFLVAIRSTAAMHQLVCTALEHTAVKCGGYQSLGSNRGCPIASHFVADYYFPLHLHIMMFSHCGERNSLD